ncbi:hypothetical protein GOP47_0022049 [Adiantum capillus-veneris]|uniref:Uncharacterized protein n=1 Tax=Adiantum capillus-veneris TaxID=13818 RepID=A0A9D4Z7H3_ADICA|nr:hypothetical protein GOP47_0022049 [Adiantum capillus-veneris]
MASRLALLLCVALFFVLVCASAVSSDNAAEGSDLSMNAAAYNKPRYGSTQGSLRATQCPGACSYRCSKTSTRKACMFFCQKCCAKCLCVPPGTYGNKQAEQQRSG